jgi:hypothetical protein
MNKKTKEEIRAKMDDIYDKMSDLQRDILDTWNLIDLTSTTDIPPETPQPDVEEPPSVEEPSEPEIVVPSDYKVSDYVGKLQAPIPFYATPTIEFIPTEGYGFLAAQFAQAIDLISEIIYWKYPDHAARMMSIIQACPMQGREFPNNPAHTWDGLCADLHYYTRGETNHTQYSPDDKPLVKIWDDNGKLTPLFDIERNRELVKLFRIICPYGEVVMDERIIEQAGYQDLGITGDKPMYRNHHTHMHLQWKLYRINLGAVIKV